MSYHSELRCPEPIFVYPAGLETHEFNNTVLEAVNRPEIRNHSDFRNLGDFLGDTPVMDVQDLFYTFEYRHKTGDVIFYPQGMEFYGRHYGWSLLVDLVSILIPQGQRTWMEFVFKDGARWGYAIIHGDIFEISYEEYIYPDSGKIGVSEWMGFGIKEGPVKEKKMFRKLAIPEGG